MVKLFRYPSACMLSSSLNLCLCIGQPRVEISSTVIGETLYPLLRSQSSRFSHARLVNHQDHSSLSSCKPAVLESSHSLSQASLPHSLSSPVGTLRSHHPLVKRVFSSHDRPQHRSRAPRHAESLISVSASAPHLNVGSLHQTPAPQPAVCQRGSFVSAPAVDILALTSTSSTRPRPLPPRSVFFRSTNICHLVMSSTGSPHRPATTGRKKSYHTQSAQLPLRSRKMTGDILSSRKPIFAACPVVQLSSRPPVSANYPSSSREA
jgi:hypothetical protein